MTEKWHRHKSPPGGWGPGSNEPTQTLFFFYSDAEESALWSSNWDPKAYNLLEKFIFMRGGAPLVFFLFDFAKIR